MNVYDHFLHVFPTELATWAVLAGHDCTKAFALTRRHAKSSDDFTDAECGKIVGTSKQIEFGSNPTKHFVKE